MSNLLSSFTFHKYVIPFVLLLLRNFVLISPYPNSQRQPLQNSLNNFSKESPKNIVSDKYSSNLSGKDSVPVFSSTQSSSSSFQPGVNKNSNQPISPIRSSDLSSKSKSEKEAEKNRLMKSTTPEVPNDQGYILAPGPVFSLGQSQGQAQVKQQSPSPSLLSPNRKQPEFGSQSAMLTFPEFLEFQPDKKRAKQTKNKDEELIEFDWNNVLNSPYNLWVDSADNSGTNSNSKLASTQKGSEVPASEKLVQHPQYTSQAQYILTELRNEIKQLSEHRAAEIIKAQCGNACEYYPSSPVPDFLLDSRFDPFPVYYGFNVKLRNNIIVNPWSAMALTNFYLPVGTGSFMRGFQLDSGSTQRLKASVSGVYSLSTTIHFRVTEAQLEQIRLKHYIQISIYASDQIYTERRPSSKFYHSIPSAKHFSVFFSSLLYLKADQPLSVEVENLSKAKIVIGQDSSFSGHLVGS